VIYYVRTIHFAADFDIAAAQFADATGALRDIIRHGSISDAGRVGGPWFTLVFGERLY
jgi:hypothetical protein